MSAADDFLDAKPAATPAANPADAFLDAKPGGEVVPFTGSNLPDLGEIRATTVPERIAMGWEKWTGGLFSSGPKAAPSHEEGVKAEWGDLPHMLGGMAVEQLLNPGNLLLAATGVPLAARLPALGKMGLQPVPGRGLPGSRRIGILDARVACAAHCGQHRIRPKLTGHLFGPQP